MKRSRESLLDIVFGLALWLGLTYLAAAVGAFASISARSFYAELARPGWAPPGRLFGPVWSCLYLLMGMAAFLVWRERHRRRVRWALILYLVQLVLNALWTWIFFVFKSGAWAFIEICVLWVAIAVTCVCFWKIRRLAAALLVPYLLWVAFALCLTLAAWRMNPSVL